LEESIAGGRRFRKGEQTLLFVRLLRQDNALLFEDGFDAADAGAGRFFFGDFEVAEGAGTGDVGAAADFDGDFLFVVGGSFEVSADGVDGDAVGVAVAEGTVGMEVVEGVIFVVFGEDDWEILVDPLIHASFDFGELFGSEFVVNIEVKAETLRGEVAALLLNRGVDFLLEGGEEEVAGGVIFHGLVASVGEAALEHAFRSGLAALALLVESLIKFVLIIVGEFEAEFIGFFDGEFERETVSILEFEEFSASQELVCAEFLEFFDAFVDGFAESLLFFGQDFEDVRAVREDVVGKFSVVLSDNREDFFEETLANAEIERS